MNKRNKMWFRITIWVVLVALLVTTLLSGIGIFLWS